MMARLALAFALITGIAVARPDGWTHFTSAKYRFSAWYPPGWHPLSPVLPGINIINFPKSEAVTGTIIPEQGALIEAGPTETVETIEENIQAELLHAGVVSPILDQTLVTGLPYADSPTTLRQVEYYENYGTATDPVLQHVTEFWCQVHGRVFAVTLSYWRGNKDAKMLEGEALAVARSLLIEK